MISNQTSGVFLEHPVDLGQGLNPSRKEEIDLHQVLVLTLVQKMVTLYKKSKKSKRGQSLVMWSVILHLSLKR